MSDHEFTDTQEAKLRELEHVQRAGNLVILCDGESTTGKSRGLYWSFEYDGVTLRGVRRKRRESGLLFSVPYGDDSGKYDSLREKAKARIRAARSHAIERRATSPLA